MDAPAPVGVTDMQRRGTASRLLSVTHARAIGTIFGCLAAAAVVGYVVAGGGAVGHVLAIVTFGGLMKMFMARGW